MDYINSMDYAIRSMEIALGLQNGGRHVSQYDSIMKDLDLEDQKRPESPENVLDANQDTVDNSPAKVNVEVEETESDVDDVFANNPSNLMLAKIRVK